MNFILLLFNITNIDIENKIYNDNYYIAFPYYIFYILLIEWGLGIEKHWKTRVLKRIACYRQALMVDSVIIIGEKCSLMQRSTTIGTEELPHGTFSASPKIKNCDFFRGIFY